ncbi:MULTISPECIES: hypothetical protein [unclassified Rhizobium]|uniref:hypothetical protein n=1 Tax=unclassified Rhizobium TaxID=2613769 RepID=UPI000AA2C84E|nr:MULTISPECIES: hypothetical protein [unclassified Rhizobium]
MTAAAADRSAIEWAAAGAMLSPQGSFLMRDLAFSPVRLYRRVRNLFPENEDPY